MRVSSSPFHSVRNRGILYFYDRRKETKTRRDQSQSKHQITVPVDALRAAGLGVGDRLKVLVAEGGRIVLEREVDPVRSMQGH